MVEVRLQQHLSWLRHLIQRKLDAPECTSQPGLPAATCLLTHRLSLGPEGQRPAFLPFLVEYVYIIVHPAEELIHVLNCLLEE